MLEIRLEKWAKVNFMKFSQGKHQALPWWEITPCTGQAELWQESSFAGNTWRSWWTSSWTQISNASLQRGRPTACQAALARMTTWLFSCPLQLWDHSWGVISTFGLCSTRKTLTIWSQSSREPPRGWSTWCRRKSWESWACSAKKGEGKEETCCLQIQNKALLGTACCKERRQQTQAEMWEILTYLRKMFYDCATLPLSPATLLGNQSLLLGTSQL